MIRSWLLALSLTFVALTGGPLHGQSPSVTIPPASDRFAWSPEHRSTANVLSNITLGAQLLADTIHSFREDDRSRALWRQGCRMGVSQGTTFLIKRVVHRTRPDGSADDSWPSGHTANAAAAQGWSWAVGIPLTFSTGYFRIGAGRHDVLDVLSGAAVGTGAHFLCDWAIK